MGKSLRVAWLKRVYYKNYFESNIFYVSDLLFTLNNTESFDVNTKKIQKTNFLVWTGLRYSVPNYLKNEIVKDSIEALHYCEIDVKIV